MKAYYCDRYGPPELLRLVELPAPVLAENEVLVRVRAASINPLDWRLMRADPFLVRLFCGLTKPKQPVPGSDFAGCVESVGADVKEIRVGDEVFGAKGFAGGAFAEYVCAREDQIALKPFNISFEEAAAVPVAAVTALMGLRTLGNLKPGQKVLVDGASGGVGTFAIQIARAYGAEVTAVCSSRNLENARRLGATHLIDYTREDFTRSGKQYDLILAANARHSVFDYRRALTPAGICVKAGGKPSLTGAIEDLLIAPMLSRMGSRKIRSFIAKLSRRDLGLLHDLLQAGKISSVIDRRYPFTELRSAIAYLEEGHAQGKVVVSLESPKDT